MVPLYANTLTPLNNGMALAAGGSGFDDQISGFYATNVARLYDPSTNTWHATGSMNVIRANAGAVRLSNGSVLVAGGMDAADDFFPYSSAEAYDPTGRWTVTGRLNHGHVNPLMALLPNGQVLPIGGTDAVPLADAELYNLTR